MLRGGGDPKVIPQYNPSHDPNVPIEQKTYAFKKQEQKPPPVSQQPIINFQYYQPPKPPMPPQSKEYPLLMTDPYKYPPYPIYLHPMGQYPQIPIIKQYNINTTGPTGNHSQLSMIYEDALPAKNFPTTITTISERLTILNFIRSSMFKVQDGENITFDDGPQSLMNKIRFTELNPYNYSGNALSNNPYKTLPEDMLIYRSCYPVNYNVGTATCAPNALGINIKIYKLSVGALLVNKQNKAKFYDYDVWREIAYNEFIREQIIRPKICPNFTLLYGYNICEGSKIDFDQIDLIRGKQKAKEPLYIKRNNIVEPNNDAYKGDVLVSLTESPTYSIFGWASKVYQSDGNIKRMVNSGFHTDEIWQSIIFQLIAGLYVMQTQGIVINNFSLPGNVFIKDLFTHGTVTSYWKYKIDGIDYYIPNYGFIVLIDAYLQDSMVSTTTIIGGAKKPSKINASIFTGSAEPLDDPKNKKQVEEKVFNIFKQNISTNVFDKSFIDNGGIKPPPETLNLLNAIYGASTNSTANVNIGHYLFNYMKRFMNNRIGTILTKNELSGINKNGKVFSKGDMIVHEEQNNYYKFVMYVETLNNGSIRVLTKDDPMKPDIIEKTIPNGTLYEYSKVFGVRQFYKPNETNLDENALLETYVINK